MQGTNLEVLNKYTKDTIRIIHEGKVWLYQTDFPPLGEK